MSTHPNPTQICAQKRARGTFELNFKRISKIPGIENASSRTDEKISLRVDYCSYWINKIQGNVFKVLLSMNNNWPSLVNNMNLQYKKLSDIPHWILGNTFGWAEVLICNRHRTKPFFCKFFKILKMLYLKRNKVFITRLVGGKVR